MGADLTCEFLYITDGFEDAFKDRDEGKGSYRERFWIELIGI